MNSSPPARAYLGVERSITGRRWTGPGACRDRLVHSMAQKTGISEPVCRILVRENVAPDEARSYLQPKLRNLMPDPSSLLDMDKAVERFVKALDNNEQIAVFADYDVDGAGSAAQIIWWLRAAGRTASLYVPDRSREGFGPNADAMRTLAESHSLIICVDCGTSAHAAIAAAEGADVIVMDHHAGEETLPPAYAVVNPNRQDESTELVYLCAAGVVFMFLVALNRKLREFGRTPCDLQDMLDLVAIATVADASPLVGLNRALVRRGLAVIRSRARPGIRALADVSKLNSPPDSYHLGFVLGPRINAGGRIGTADLGARLLATDDQDEADYLAEQLETFNSARRNMADKATDEAIEMYENAQSGAPLVWAASKDWHPGVAGIVSARLSEAARRPAVVIAVGAATGKGSARSVAGVDIGAAVIRCRNEGLLISGGGHKMAAGLEVRAEMIETAMGRLTEMVAHLGTNPDLTPGFHVDGAIQPEAVTVELIESLEAAGPFGSGAPAPRFALPNLRVTFRRWVGTGHLQLRLSGETGRSVDAIAFRAGQSPLGKFLDGCGSAPVHIAGRLQADHFRGRTSAKLQVQDAAPG